MIPRARILMLEANRYRALLLQRALANHIPDAIIVKYDSAATAAEELVRNVYPAVIINLDCLSAVEAERLKGAILAREPELLFLQASPETSRRIISRLTESPNSVLLDFSVTADQTAEQLAARLAESPAETPESGDHRALHLSRLVLSGE